MKKILLCFLAATMVLSLCGFSDVTDPNVDQAVATLQDFGIISGYADGTFKPDNKITRAEFASMVVSAMMYKDLTPQNTGSFSDVPISHWASSVVYIAKQLGIVSGTSETAYSPSNVVTYEQAIKMIVSGLGYEEEARESGGYPDGYIEMANELGLLEGILYAKTAAATRGNIALILESALDAELYRIDNSMGSIQRQKSDRTLRMLHWEAASINQVEFDETYREPDPIDIQEDDMEPVG